MTYRIEGLQPDAFQPLFQLDDVELAAHKARRVVADGPDYPCRISLADAVPGETLLLVNHCSQPANSPFRACYAIYVTRSVQPAVHVDQVPPLLDSRTLSLRAFDEEGMSRGAALAFPGEADSRIRSLLEEPAVVEVHAHSATHGCFLARIERH